MMETIKWVVGLKSCQDKQALEITFPLSYYFLGGKIHTLSMPSGALEKQSQAKSMDNAKKVKLLISSVLNKFSC